MPPSGAAQHEHDLSRALQILVAPPSLGAKKRKKINENTMNNANKQSKGPEAAEGRRTTQKNKKAQNQQNKLALHSLHWVSTPVPQHYKCYALPIEL